MVTPSNSRLDNTEALIWTEGKTDWKHLKKAQQMLELNSWVDFHETEDGDLGADALLKKCKIFAETPQAIPMIFIFDRDDDSIVKSVSDTANPYKCWGNNVFSFALPVPAHREGHENICIEFYYSDDDITRVDSQGRRLFLSSEFNENSGSHKTDTNIHVVNVGRLKSVTDEDKAKIIDSQVFTDNKNIALSKSDFADYIYGEVEPFADVGFGEFRRVFVIVTDIINAARPKMDLCLPELQSFFANLESDDKPVPDKAADVLELATRILETALHLFIVSTIRSYEDAIVNEPPTYEKKVASIKKIISEMFTSPSLATLRELTRHCYYLVDDEAPEELIMMKECLGRQFVLGHFGEMLDDLERIFPPDNTRARIVNKSGISRSLFDYVIPELSKYTTKIKELRGDNEENETGDISDINIRDWQYALEILVAAVNPILTQEFVLESLDSVDTTNRNYSVGIRTYSDSNISVSQRSVSFEELDEFDSSTTSITMRRNGEKIVIYLFPFLVINGDKLYYYRRTRATGYEFYSVSGNRAFVERTKRKFSQSAFRVGTKGLQQSLFWTESLPVVNDANGVRANIPSEGLTKFFGRQRQIKTIKRQIIEIPNQNGIVYGVGGVGKTALMIEVSRDLFNERGNEVLFTNIIWASAKRNYYNPTLDIVESKTRQFESLDNVVSTILEFFAFEGLEEYSFEDKKVLLLDLLLDNKVLLVLDNFEAITKGEQESIIEFFGIDAKHHLRMKPENLKVIITSREQIPSGFHQIALKGLDLKESKQLMADLYAPYKIAREELTDEQKATIHKITSGIPLVIKHCFGQIYEYNYPFNSVVNSISSADANNVVDFSFEEIFRLVRQDDCQREIILVLELVNCPLLVRQIADILEREETDINAKIPLLSSFQCVKTNYYGLEEKYETNPEVRLFTRRLIQENSELVDAIKQKILRNFTLEKKMDYTTEEMGIVSVFDDYLSQGQLLEAKEFMEREMGKKPDSILLNYHYASYLKEQKGETGQAIEVLERILGLSDNHPTILRLLVACYTSLDIPNYEKAGVYVRQIESGGLEDDNQMLELSEFYVRWSTSIKMNKEISPDPIDEMLRQKKYKDLSNKALQWLDQIGDKTHYGFYLTAQCHFNNWKYDAASQMIDRAIQLCGQDSHNVSTYVWLRDLVHKKEEQYSGRRSAHR